MFKNKKHQSDVDSYTKNAMLDLYISHQRHSGMASALAMTIVAIALWNKFPTIEVLLWLASGYAISIIRAVIHPWINRNVSKAKQFNVNKYTILAIVSISGTVWGTAAWLFLDMAHIEAFVLIIVILISMCAAAMSTHTSYLPAVWLFLFIVLGLLSFKLLTMNYMALATLALLFGLMLASLSRSLHGIIQRAITVDQRNKILLQEATIAKKSAENANRAKSRFLATASHDLRQPLHAIALLTNLLKLKCNNTEQEHIAENMEASTDAMMSLFDSILDVSRLDAGITRAHIVAIDLTALIETLILQFKPQAKKKGLTLKLEHNNIQPETPYLVMADKIHLERCLNNIVNNAIKFTQHGSIIIKLQQANTNTLKIFISDSGEGIAKKDLQHIFNEFSQATAQQRAQGQGLGLGLSIVKRLTKLMDIDIQLASTVGEGSCFTLTLLKAPKDTVLATLPTIPQTESTLSDLNILIVDDDDAVRESLAQLIQSWGCNVFTASDKPQAIVAVEQAETIDALLMDYGLRNGVTGIEVIEQLYQTKLTHKPPALIITGDTSSHSMATLNGSGFAYLHKPAKPIKIRNFLQRHCLVNG